jgi:hypothetical protein
MKTELFEVPGSLRVEYQEHKEGPSPVYVAWKPGTSQTFRERSPLLKFAQWPASTPTGRRLRDWLDELQKGPPEAPEADPQANTKMVT